LKLNYSATLYDVGNEMEASTLMSTIEEEVGEMLEILSFSVLYCDSITMGVKPLKKFSSLKSLELHLRVLIDHAERKSKILFGLPTGGAQDLPSMCTLLPSTLEKLCLMVDNINTSSRHLIALFSDLSTEIHDRLPNLKNIIIRYGEKSPIETGHENSGPVAYGDCEKLEGSIIEPLNNLLLQHTAATSADKVGHLCLLTLSLEERVILQFRDGGLI
jgi:hypothetical protein